MTSWMVSGKSGWAVRLSTTVPTAICPSRGSPWLSALMMRLSQYRSSSLQVPGRSGASMVMGRSPPFQVTEAPQRLATDRRGTNRVSPRSRGGCPRSRGYPSTWASELPAERAREKSGPSAAAVRVPLSQAMRHSPRASSRSRRGDVGGVLHQLGPAGDGAALYGHLRGLRPAGQEKDYQENKEQDQSVCSQEKGSFRVFSTAPV